MTNPGEAVAAKKAGGGGSLRPVVPYLIAVATGILVAYLIVVLFVFPVDPDLVTPEVPVVVGDTYDAATSKLANAGFLAAQGEVRKAAGAPGTVLEQVPSGGTRQKVGSKVVLHTVAPPK